MTAPQFSGSSGECGLSSFLYTFHASLLSLVVSANSDGMINFTPGFGAQSTLSWGTGLADTPTIGINVLAAIFFVLILSLQRTFKSD